MTIKATPTWPGDDVTIQFDDHPFILFEDPRHNKPPQGDWLHGYVKTGFFVLTCDQAEQLAKQLLSAAKATKDINDNYIRTMKGERFDVSTDA